MRLRIFQILVLSWFSALLVAAEEIVVQRGGMTENISCLADPTQTYTLYLPGDWDPERTYPVLLIFDPRQRGTFAAEIFRAPAEELGWVLISSNDTRSDGPFEPNVKALNALWPEVHRYSVDTDRIYSAGFSGGGILTLLLGMSTGRMAGAIDCGGRLPPEMSLEGANFAHYGTAGRFDFNYMEMHHLDRMMEKEGQPHRLDIFEGRHQWMSSEVAGTAMRWLEVVAMKEGRRKVDPVLVSRTYDADLKRAEGLENGGRLLEAHRQYEMMVRTYDGLHPTASAEKSVDRMRRSAGLTAARREQEKADEYETSLLKAMNRAIATMLASDNPMPAARLRGELHLDRLRRDAGRGGARGDAAERVLASIFSQTSFYLPERFFISGELTKAATVLEIAAEFGHELPYVHYRLACAYSRLRQVDNALEQIERAVEHGFRNLELLKGDPDLEQIRSEPRFRESIRKLEQDEPVADSQNARRYRTLTPA